MQHVIRVEMIYLEVITFFMKDNDTSLLTTLRNIDSGAAFTVDYCSREVSTDTIYFTTLESQCCTSSLALRGDQFHAYLGNRISID